MEIVNLRQIITPVCLFVLVQKFYEQLQFHQVKIFKTKPLWVCDFFFRVNELSMNLGENFDKSQKSFQESSGFSACRWSKLGWANCLLVWSRIIKLWGKRTSALNFASVQISNVKHTSAVLSVNYHDKINTMEQASTNFLMSLFI